MKMKKKIFVPLFLMIVICVISSNGTGNNVFKSTEDQQIDVMVTIYNSLALIKDTRKIKLDIGDGELKVVDIASAIIPETVYLRSINNQPNLSVFEQNYRYDLINSDKLLDKYVGKKIKIIDWNKFQDRKEEIEAVLISNNDGQIYKINGDIYLDHPGYKVLPGIPDDLVTTPTLTWLFKNEKKQEQDIEIYYLARNVGWNANYIVSIDEISSSADIKGWVTLDNKSGVDYKDATVRLAAGNVNIIDRVPHIDQSRRAFKTMALESAEQFSEKEFSDYHVYDLYRKTTLKNKEAKQISFFDASGISIKHEYIIKGTEGYAVRQYRTENKKQPVAVYVSFTNSHENKIGIPIPAGVMRVYKKDNENLYFVGEDRIDHTPKNEELRLHIGNAFDVIAERIQTDYKRVTSNLHESEWSITIRNHKDKDVVVSVIEPVLGNWEVIKNSHPFEKVDASTIKFDVKVLKNEKVEIIYKIKIGL